METLVDGAASLRHLQRILSAFVYSDRICVVTRYTRSAPPIGGTIPEMLMPQFLYIDQGQCILMFIQWLKTIHRCFFLSSTICRTVSLVSVENMRGYQTWGFFFYRVYAVFLSIIFSEFFFIRSGNQTYPRIRYVSRIGYGVSGLSWRIRAAMDFSL